MRSLIIGATLLASTGAMAGDYASTLERQLLRAGYDVSVSAQGQKLLVLGRPIDKPMVYELVSGQVLERAASDGFKSVEFLSLYGSGRWTFDLSNGVPKCSATGRVVCRD